MYAMATISDAFAIAVQHHQAGQLQAAEQIYRQILAVDPNQVDALHLLGVIALQMGKHELAIQHISRAIELNGTESVFHNNLGNAFKAHGKLDEAVACFRRALDLTPDYAEAHSNLGTAFKDLGRLDEAVACHRRALELKPDLAEAHSNLSNTFRQLRRFDDALTSYTRALELKPDFAGAHNNLSLLRLLRGDLERGWPEYEWRWKTKQLVPREFPQPQWDGKPLDERTILLHAEQGLGDTIQFVRYAALVKQQNAAATVIVECQRRLAKLL